jgi:tRNA-Thr(GGU) m(6)t(6)A37 methyltransferase TsaA
MKHVGCVGTLHAPGQGLRAHALRPIGFESEDPHERSLDLSKLGGGANLSGMSAATTPRGEAGEYLRPIGVIRSELKSCREAPKQGSEQAPDAWLEVHAWAAEGLLGLTVHDDIIVITWLHEADRAVLQVHPRSDPHNPLAGVFATRSPDRPNPLGLHPVTVRAIQGNRLRIGPIEAIDGTPVVDIKPVLK